MLGRWRGTLANVSCVAGGGGGWRPLLNRPLACILYTRTECAEHCKNLAQCRQLRLPSCPSADFAPELLSQLPSPNAPPAHPSSHGRAMLFGMREATIRATRPSAAFTRNTRYLLSGKP